MSVTTLPAFTCPVFLPDHASYGAELAGFNVILQHTPHLVVAATSTTDIAEAVRHAHGEGLLVSVIGGGHGVGLISEGMVITTRRLNQIAIDPERKTATFGAGVIWADVLEAAAPFGLLPVVGSSPTVGAIGFLLGGGLSPIGRSHGFASDYVERFTVVSGTGEVLEASAHENPELFWALRGGKSGLGIVTEATIRLVEQPTLYGGAIIFEEDHIETVVRGWVDWTATADADITTSIVTIDFPDMDIAPPPFRGKRMLMLRFAYPGDEQRGAELAAPLRNLAPSVMDTVATMPSHAMAAIHMDPTDPMPAWEAGAHYGNVTSEWLDTWLEHFGPGKRSPLVMVEIRHIGGRMAIDVAEGSAVGGRESAFQLLLIAMYPPLFAEIAPAAADAAFADLQEWALPVTSVNFIGHNTRSTPWSPETTARLQAVRQAVDPDNVFNIRW